MASKRSQKMTPTRQTNGYWSYSLIPLCLVGAYCYNQNFCQVIFIGAAIILANGIMEIILRLTMLIQEWSHIRTHYQDNQYQLYNNVLHVTSRSRVACVFASIIVYYLSESQPPECVLYIFITSAVYILMPVLQFKEAPIYTSYQIESDEVDVGAYMAISFFYGYLKLTLQRQSDPGCGLLHAMETYEASNNIKFPRKVLFILIPRSMHCPHRLTDRSPIMEEAQTLEPVEQDIAGVKNRNYKNSVYKIKDMTRGGYFYVAAEYASPLRTFFKSQHGLFKKYFDNHKLEVVDKFHKTIVRLVNSDPNMEGLCEFICFDDKDANGEYVDIGRMLLKHLVKNAEQRR